MKPYPLDLIIRQHQHLKTDKHSTNHTFAFYGVYVLIEQRFPFCICIIVQQHFPLCICIIIPENSEQVLWNMIFIMVSSKPNIFTHQRNGILGTNLIKHCEKYDELIALHCMNPQKPLQTIFFFFIHWNWTVKLLSFYVHIGLIFQFVSMDKFNGSNFKRWFMCLRRTSWCVCVAIQFILCTTIKVYKNVNKRGAFLFSIFNFTKQVMYHFITALVIL